MACNLGTVLGTVPSITCPFKRLMQESTVIFFGDLWHDMVVYIYIYIYIYIFIHICIYMYIYKVFNCKACNTVKIN